MDRFRASNHLSNRQKYYKQKNKMYSFNKLKRILKVPNEQLLKDHSLPLAVSYLEHFSGRFEGSKLDKAINQKLDEIYEMMGLNDICYSESKHEDDWGDLIDHHPFG